MKVIVFGAGAYGSVYCRYHDRDVDIVAVADNSVARIGKRLLEYDVISPDKIPSYNFDKVIVTIENLSIAESVVKQINTMGISDVEIYDSTPFLSPNIQALYMMSEIINERKIQGSIAECGVNRGWSAVYLNKFYPNRKLFLFDTFAGFDERDMNDESHESKKWLDKRGTEYAIPKQAEYILNKCAYPETVIIKPGYVPETFRDIEDEKFAFVHLDMDMYKPQLAALRFFSERMSEGGVFFLHDYYNPDLPGTKRAVEAFSHEKNFFLIPSASSSDTHIGSHIALILH